MKIIITESQLDDIYDEFITSHLSNLKKYTNVRKRNNFGYDTYDGHTFLVNDDNEVIIEIDPLGRYWISRELTEMFNNIFGIDDMSVINHEFKKWLMKHLDVENPKVFTAHSKNWERWNKLELKP